MIDIDAYRAEAERFLVAFEAEQLAHFAGHKHTLETAPLYQEFRGLGSRAAITGLLASGHTALAVFALDFRVEAEASDLADQAATAELELGAESERQRALSLRAEPDHHRRFKLREGLERFRSEVALPLAKERHAIFRQVTRDLGWTSPAAMHREITGVDVRMLAREAHAFLVRTDDLVEECVRPAIASALELSPSRVGIAELPRFQTLPLTSADTAHSVAAVQRTMRDLGIENGFQRNVTLDLVPNSEKRARAFCSALRIPTEINVVVSGVNGCSGWDALLHEIGHAAHLSHVDGWRCVEERRLGDDAVTEAFAFLFAGLLRNRGWLVRHGLADSPGVLQRARIHWLLESRRSAGLMVLAGSAGDPALSSDLPGAEGGRLIRPLLDVDLSDVHLMFHPAHYVRGMRLARRLERHLKSLFGPGWFQRKPAGNWLESLWRRGQPPRAEDLALPAEFAGQLSADAIWVEEAPETPRAA